MCQNVMERWMDLTRILNDIITSETAENVSFDSTQRLGCVIEP